MIRTLIVDDEELARKRLAGLLKPFPDIEIVGEAGDGEEAVEKVLEMRPDLVFLDIQMPEFTGLEVAVSLPSPRPKIIFCTAFDQYALDAFEVHALDYLLKPVSRARLGQALERVRSRSGTELDAIERVAAEQGPLRFLGKRGTRFHVVGQEEVLYFSSEEGLTSIHTGQGRYWLEPTLADLEERLGRQRFFRISRQEIVNLEAIDEVVPLTGGYGMVILSDRSEHDVSRRRMKELMQILTGERGSNR